MRSPRFPNYVAPDPTERILTEYAAWSPEIAGKIMDALLDMKFEFDIEYFPPTDKDPDSVTLIKRKKENK